jgi:hypothetical protein
MEEQLRGFFAPLALHGYDVTTARRLRIPPEELEGDAMPKEPWSLPADSREMLRPYLSVREFDEQSPTGFVPFRDSGRTCALLLFTCDDIPSYIDSFTHHTAELSSLLCGIPHAVGRSGDRSGGGSEIVPAEQKHHAVEQTLKKADREQQTLLFLYLDFNPLLETLTARFPWAEPFYYYLEILRLTARYFRNNGRTVALGGNTALIILESKRAKKGRLIVHQLQQRISGVCTAELSLPEPHYSQRYYPSDGEEPADFLEGYL